MLQAIRSKATSFVVKILFGLLIVTFGVWGIGDIFRNHTTDTTVAKVGDRDVSMDQLSQAVRSDMDRLRGVFGGALDANQAKQLGVVDSALQRIVSGDLMDLEIERLKLAVGDEAVSQAITANPAFRSPSGAFDRNVYVSVLRQNRLSTEQYEGMLRGDIVRNQLTGALTDGMTPPKELVDALYRSRFERRTADTVVLPPSAAGTIPAPTDEQLDAFYKAHPDSFRTPELRSFTLATLRVTDVAAGITVPADKLKQEYDARQDDFHVPEQRQLKQMLLPDEAKAKDAEAQLAAGKDFDAVAKAVANADPQTTDLGLVKRDDLPAALADAVFAVPEGGTTQPVQTNFGWHILRVTAIKPAEVQSFDQVKDKLAKDVATEMAGDQAAQTANQIDDALAGGASLADVAQKFNLKTAKIDGVDSEDRDANGKPVELPQPTATILRSAFTTASGQVSPLTELGNDGYYLLQTDKVTASTVKPLDQVHDDAVKLWQNDQRSAALAKLGEEIAAEVNAGKSLKDVATARKLTVATTAPLLRTGSDDKTPPALIAKLFDAKQGQAVAAPTGDTVTIAQLTAVSPADPAKDAAATAQLSQQLGGAMRNDLLGEYDQALRRIFPVQINQANLDRVL